MNLRDLLRRNTGLKPDGFPLDESIHNVQAHCLVSEYLIEAARVQTWWETSFKDLDAGKAILAADRDMQVEVVRALIQRIRYADSRDRSADEHWSYIMHLLLVGLLGRRMSMPPADITALVDLAVGKRMLNYNWKSVARIVEQHIEEAGLSDDLRKSLTRWAKLGRYSDADDRKRADRIQKMLGTAPEMPLVPAEPWAEMTLAEIAAMDAAERERWTALLGQAESANGSEPSSAWLKRAGKTLETIGTASFVERTLRWFPETARNPDKPFHYKNADVLKGLVWMCRLVDDARLPAALAGLAEAAYRKIPEEGARSAKVGNACVSTLGALEGMEAVAQLERLRRKVKYRVALSLVEKAFQAAAERAGLSPEELEEMAVPTYGMEKPGNLRVEVGGYVAEMSLGRGKPAWAWSKDGKAMKSVPSAVKTEFADELKAMKATADDMAKMLPAQRERVERLLLSERRWDLATWRERYRDHPLIAHFARRLIWFFEASDGRSALGIWRDGHIVDVDGHPIDWLSPETQVALWHPIVALPETVLRWRIFLEERGITQPFKQAHREVYILTDAELKTQTYSNRFAAHVLKQHQFSALCRQRGWRYSLQGGFDGVDDTVAHLDLPAWGLRAEFWTDAPWDTVGDDDMTEAGIYLYIATDQVRFTDLAGRPLPLADVPALVLSEVMRDVDLFVGVSSVGNDPTWADRGDLGVDQGDYWRAYSFGDLGVSAQTRRDVLSRLVPRLKIADRCTLPEGSKFLVVRGDRRTYKIHLGSGNILMEPNDQYLCIVPDRSGKGASDVFLPFEGDSMLSVILSKAFLLADDRRITDPTITRQIGR